MKFRNGFVSNSSSSSFLIMINGKDVKEAQRVLEAYLGLPPGHPLAPLVKEVVSAFMGEVNGDNKWDRNEYYDDDELLEGDDLLAEQKLDDGWSVYRGSFTNEGEPMEGMLCEMDWDIVTPNLIIKGGGGF